MPGPNLEVFKFGLYLFFPIVLMVQFGDPAWYRKYALPYKERIFPRDEDTNKPPTGRNEIRAELERLRARKIARRLERENSQAASSSKYPQDEERLV